MERRTAWRMDKTYRRDNVSLKHDGTGGTDGTVFNPLQADGTRNNDGTDETGASC